MKTEVLDHPALLMIVSSGIPCKFALEVAAALVLCGLNPVSMPAFVMTSLIHLEMVLFETGLCGLIVLMSNLSVFLRSFVQCMYSFMTVTMHSFTFLG